MTKIGLLLATDFMNPISTKTFGVHGKSKLIVRNTSKINAVIGRV